MHIRGRAGAMVRMSVWGATGGCLLVFLVLRFGGPQWSKWIYMFQAYVMPGEAPELRPGYTGRARAWYVTGQLLGEAEYRLGKPQGKMRRWYADGAPRVSYRFRDGKRDGEWIEWNERGGVVMRGYYKKGMPWHGRCYWSECKAWNSVYRDGAPCSGTFLEWDATKEEHKPRLYRNGKMACVLDRQWEPEDGTMLVWDEQRDAAMERTYRAGQVVRETVWNGTLTWWDDAQGRFRQRCGSLP